MENFNPNDFKTFRNLLVKAINKLEKKLVKIEETKDLLNNGCQEKQILNGYKKTLEKIDNLPFFKGV